MPATPGSPMLRRSLYNSRFTLFGLVPVISTGETRGRHRFASEPND